MSASDRPRRRALLIPFAVLAGLVLIHGVYWIMASGQIASRAEAWIAAQEAAGYEIDHEGLSVRGYPFRFSLRARAPSIAAPEAEGGWRASLDQLAATAQFYDLNHWILTPDGQARVQAMTEAGPADWRVSAESARLSVAGSNGLTRRLGASAQALVLEAQTGPQPAVRAIAAVNVSGLLTEAGALALRVQADDLQLADGVLDPALQTAFGREAAVWRMDASITAFAALARAGDPAEWRRAGGVLDIHQAQLIWGAADVSGQGQVALDSRLWPEGRLSVIVTDPETLITTLVQAGLVHDEQGEALRLAALMAPRREGGIALPLRLREGGLFLGPARIGAFAGAGADAQAE